MTVRFKTREMEGLKKAGKAKASAKAHEPEKPSSRTPEEKKERAARKKAKKIQKAQQKAAEQKSGGKTEEKPAASASTPAPGKKRKRVDAEAATDVAEQACTGDEVKQFAKKRKLDAGASPKVKSVKKEPAPAADSDAAQSDDDADMADAKDDAESNGAGKKASAKSKAAAKKKQVKRFIVFVGNLPYRTTADEIKGIFKKGGVVSVRMPTDKATNKPKGFAFVEFADADSLRTGLMMHQSLFGTRKINVELTAGGGGKGEGRKAKIEQRRTQLATERKKQMEKGKKKGPAAQHKGQVPDATPKGKKVKLGAGAAAEEPADDAPAKGAASAPPDAFAGASAGDIGDDD